MTEIKREQYQCKFCHKLFVREGAYLRHKCKQMERNEQIQTVIGQAAYSYYGDWMRYQKRLVPKIQTFLTSNFYVSFIKFAEFVKQVKMADTQLFIRMMIKAELPPTLWSTDDAYRLYLEYIDKKLTPKEQVEIMLTVMDKIADAAECDISEIFDVLAPNEVLQLIRERKFTPWLLLKSTKFKKMLATCNKGQQKQFETLIRPTYWMYKFDKEPNTVKTMEKLAQELNL